MPSTQQSDYCRFWAVSDWELQVSHTQPSGNMNARYLLRRDFRNVPFFSGEWRALEGSGRATYDDETGKAFTQSDDGTLARLTLLTATEDYQLDWSGIELESYSNFGWHNPVGKFPKEALSIEGRGTEDNGSQWEWSLIPNKEVTYTNYELKLRVFIPAPIANLEGERGAFEVHAGDGREFSYEGGTHRAMQIVTVSLDPRLDSPIIDGPDYGFGESITYQHAPVRKVPKKPWWLYELPRGWAEEHQGTRDTLDRTQKNSLVTIEQTGLCSHIKVVFFGAAKNPAALYPKVPGIDWNINVTLDFDYSDEQAHYRVLAEHDGFPAFELYLNRKRIYEHDPEKEGKSPLSLVPIAPNIKKDTGRKPIP